MSFKFWNVFGIRLCHISESLLKFTFNINPSLITKGPLTKPVEWVEDFRKETENLLVEFVTSVNDQTQENKKHTFSHSSVGYETFGLIKEMTQGNLINTQSK